MSDSIQHECGIALIRLKKPIQYYIDNYGSAFFGVNKLHLLMEKQHNRGQDNFPTSRTIDNYILIFRKLFEPNPKNPIYFHSIRGVGYKFTLQRS